MVGGIVREITARPLFYFNNCTFNRGKKNENSVAPSHKRHLERTYPFLLFSIFKTVFVDENFGRFSSALLNRAPISESRECTADNGFGCVRVAKLKNRV